jgi:hypothetical protein
MARQDYDPEANSGTGGGNHYVFHPDLKVKFPPTGDVTTTFVILPARPMNPIEGWEVPFEEQYVEYRRYDLMPPHGKPHKFSHWIRQYFVHEWVGGKSNIISPRTYPDERIVQGSDPVRVLSEHMASRGNLWHLFGLEADGKRSKDRTRAEELFICKIMPRYASRKFLVNLCVVGADGLEETTLQSFPEGAIVNRGGEDDNGRRAEWGLFDELNRLGRNVDPKLVAENPSAAFYWGDITDPQGAVPVSLYKEKPPTGSAVKMWVAKPTTYAPRPISASNLSRRTDLADADILFAPYSPRRVIVELVKAFGMEHPDLLIGAFSTAFPIKRMINDFVNGEPDHEHESENEAVAEHDDIPMHTHSAKAPSPAPAADPAPTPPPARTYAPPASVIESNVPAFWVSVNKGQPEVKTTVEAKALAESHLLGEVMLMPKDQSKGWGKANDYGFGFKEAAPPPPPVAEVAAPPPPPPAVEAAPPPPPPPAVEAAPPPPPVAAASSAPAAVIESAPPPPTASAAPAAPATTPVSMDLLRAQLDGAPSGSPTTLSDPSGAPPPPPPPPAR